MAGLCLTFNQNFEEKELEGTPILAPQREVSPKMTTPALPPGLPGSKTPDEKGLREKLWNEKIFIEAK